jgi:hypothetical protein
LTYRIIHFATHGALAGQVSGNAEPGLILTPPTNANERDDGYLSGSEIAQLKLDADWVILSACNTAAGNADGAEALSGLARAFFYAGARALLVSHWAVASDATVKLITGAVGRMASDKTIGRAEAMRQSMLALIDKGEAYGAHPAYWAPFVVVGEGATKVVEAAAPVIVERQPPAERNLIGIEARPPSVTDALPSGIFAVVSSTRAREFAEQTAAEVRAKGAAYLGAKRVNVHETDIPGKGIFYRVLIEPSSGRSEATKICNKLKSLGFVDCFLVAQP